jgi:hypothetical protein
MVYGSAQFMEECLCIDYKSIATSKSNQKICNTQLVCTFQLMHMILNNTHIIESGLRRTILGSISCTSSV